MSPAELAAAAIHHHDALQKQSELAWLIAELAEHPKDRVLEIGAWKGGVTWLWLELGASHVTVIDPGAPLPLPLRTDPRVRHIPEVSKNIRLDDETFDVVHIDGDHSTAAVRHDWDTFGPLAPIVVLHDIVHWTPNDAEVEAGFGDRGVEQLWAEIVNEYEGHVSEYVDPGAQRWPDGRTIDHREGGFGVVFR